MATHAVRGGRTPGNAFFDMRLAASHMTVHAGDRIVDDVAHEVITTTVLGKSATSVSDRIWGNWQERDGELVILTCLQRAGETSSARDNLAILAERTP